MDAERKVLYLGPDLQQPGQMVVVILLLMGTSWEQRGLRGTPQQPGPPPSLSLHWGAQGQSCGCDRG